MPNENLKPTASQKITSILNKLSIGEAIEVYHQVGDDLHKRIDDDKKKLSQHENKLLKKENE